MDNLSTMFVSKEETKDQSSVVQAKIPGDGTGGVDGGVEGGRAVEKQGEVQQDGEHSDSDDGDWESSDGEDVVSELLWLASLDPAGSSSVFLDAARKLTERPPEGDLASGDLEVGALEPEPEAEEEDYDEDDEAVYETVDELMFIASLDPAGPRSEFLKAAVALLQDS